MITTRAIQFAFDNDVVYFLSIFDWCNGIKTHSCRQKRTSWNTHTIQLIIIILILIIITSPSPSASQAFVKINLRLLFGLSYSKDFFCFVIHSPSSFSFYSSYTPSEKKILSPPRIILAQIKFIRMTLPFSTSQDHLRIEYILCFHHFRHGFLHITFAISSFFLYFFLFSLPLSPLFPVAFIHSSMRASEYQYSL